MNKNKIKKSANFFFWLGLSPFIVFIITILFIVCLIIFQKNRQVSIEVTPEAIFDTVYIQCQKKHCDDLMILPLKKETKKKQNDTIHKPIPQEMENIDTTEKSQK